MRPLPWPVRLVGLTALLAASARATPVVGTVSDLLGTVERRPGPSGGWRPAQLDEGVAIGDGVQTRVQSAAQLTFVDGTVLSLGERTRLAISTLLFDPAQAPPEIQVALRQGQADVHVARVPLVMRLPSGEEARFAPGTATRVRWQAGRLEREPLPRLLIAPRIFEDAELVIPDDDRPEASTPDPGRPLPGDGGAAGARRGTRLEIRVRLRGDE